MLSPATPLTLAFLAAFVLLLLATLSTPVIPSIPLGNYNDYSFGVFGYCQIDGPCSPANIGYNISLARSGTAVDNLSSPTRTKLSYILIVHPIAAFLVFICTILAGAAHFPAPSHSSRYLLGLLILTFPTLLVTLLAFLVNILLFIPPHMGWGGWIVLPATLIITACSVVTCAMRRTLVSRKARKERIEKNEDMNGSVYYAMKQDTPFRAPEPQARATESQFRAPEPSFARAESPPPLPGTNGVFDQEKRAQFDEQNYGRPSPHARGLSAGPDGSGQRRGDAMSGTSAFENSAAVRSMTDPMPPGNFDDRSTPRGSYESRSRSARGGASGYGRGGTPPQFYPRGGRGAPRGPRGGYFGPPRGAYRGSAGSRGPPPPGWIGYGRGGPGQMGSRGRPGPPPPGYPNNHYGGPPRGDPNGGMMYSDGGSYDNGQPQDRSGEQWPAQDNEFQSAAGDWDLNDTRDDAARDFAGPAAPAYDRRPSTGESLTRDPASFGFSGRVPSPARSQSAPRSPSPPPPVPAMSYPGSTPGQAVEMDAGGSSPKPYSLGDQGQSRNLDSQPHEADGGGTYLPTSTWQNQPSRFDNRSPPSRYASPLEYPRNENVSQPMVAQANSSSPLRHKPKSSSGTYHEDMDPRFSEDNTAGDPIVTEHQQSQPQSPTNPVPSILMPGGTHYQQHPSSPPLRDPNTLHPSYGSGPGPTDLRDHSRSPAASEDEGSNFTSISQRGVNPEWQPSPGWGGQAYGPPVQSGGMQSNWRNAPRERDQILTANPDFTVPGAGPGRTSRAAGHARGMSSGGSHRYPDPV